MKFIEVDKKLIDFNLFLPEAKSLFLEINLRGEIERELGVDANMNIIHKYPDNGYKYGKYGVFDLNLFDLAKIENDISKNMFEMYWRST
jgi:hypothetical protein